MRASTSAALACLAVLSVVSCTPNTAPSFDGALAPVKLAPPLPVAPPVWGHSKLADTTPADDVVEVSLTAAETDVQLGSRTVRMYTYNGQFPGPQLEAKAGDRVIVHFTNSLAEPTTIHWHGLRISELMDGNPRIQTPVAPGGTFTYDFVVPEAGTFWYHPHVRANEQVEKGLYGTIVVRAADEPVYDADRYFVLDDILLQGGAFVPFLSGHMEEMHGRFGNLLLTNGKPLSTDAAALTDTAPRHRVERWRVVNTANARTFELGIKNASVRVIGTDGGLLATGYQLNGRLTVAVGQRYELEVSFADANPVLETYVLGVDANNQTVELTFPIFEGLLTTELANANFPVIHGRAPSGAVATETRSLQFDAMLDANNHLMWMINGVAHSDQLLFTLPKGTPTKLVLKNMVGMEHPFHLHGQFFEVLNRNEPGFKDTVLVGGNETVEILTTLDNPGRWMAHCHILEHSELGMMAEFQVTP